MGSLLGTLSVAVAAPVILLCFVFKTKQPSFLRWAIIRFFAKMFLSKLKSPEHAERMSQEVQELVRTQEASGNVPEGGICFIGSSTWRFWGIENLRSDMAPLPVYNMGFGGSVMENVLAHSDELVLRHKPKLIMYYTGVNNINAGDRPDIVVEGFKQFVAKLRAASKSVTIVFVAINLSLLHGKLGLIEFDRETNTRIKDFCDQNPAVEYLDPWCKDPRLQSDDSLYMFDGLHLNRAGYEVLTIVMKPLLESLWESAKRTQW